MGLALPFSCILNVVYCNGHVIILTECIKKSINVRIIKIDIKKRCQTESYKLLNLQALFDKISIKEVF